MKIKNGISTEPTQSNIAKITALLADAPGRLEILGEGFSDVELRQRPAERSIIEILAHLLNSEARSSEAIYSAILAEEPLLIDIHPERQLGKLLRFDQFGFSDLLVYFKFRRAVLVRVLESLAGEQWLRSVREAGKKRKESVYWRARAMALHELEHLSEMERELSGRVKSG